MEKKVNEQTQDYNWPFKTQDGLTKYAITVQAGGVRVLYFKK